MPQYTKRSAACDELVTAVRNIDNGPESTPEDLTKAFFEALTKFASTMDGHTSVIANAGDKVEEFMFIYYP